MKNLTSSFAGVATLALAALPMTALFAVSAHAQPATMVVGDLNLVSASGQKAVTSRIAHLSHEYCVTERNLTQKAACEKAIVAEAQAKVAAITTDSRYASAR